MGNRYLDEFLSLKCAGDVLNVCSPIARAEKEISEAMAVIRVVRRIAMNSPGKYALVDLCSGNALVPVIAAHLLPLLRTHAIDRVRRERRWEQCRNFHYWQGEILPEDAPLRCELTAIVTAVHPCRDAAPACIDAYRRSKAEYMVLMPCCVGPMDGNRHNFLGMQLTRYDKWCMYLEHLVGENTQVRSYRDRHVQSPCNVIIMARKKEAKCS